MVRANVRYRTAPRYRRLPTPITLSITPTMLMNHINPPIRRCSGIVRWRKDLPPTSDLMDGIATRFDSLSQSFSLSLSIIYKEEEKKIRKRRRTLCNTSVTRSRSRVTPALRGVTPVLRGAPGWQEKQMCNFGGLIAVLLDPNQPQVNQYLDGAGAGHALQPCGRSG